MSETVSEKSLRHFVRDKYPHIKISIRTIDFGGFGFGSSKCLTITDDRNSEEVRAINDLAAQAGILRDSAIRCYPKVAA
ncbi:MAG: hypothetical protein ACLP29_00735 [Dissulfurispiraceae bacterium]